VTHYLAPHFDSDRDACPIGMSRYFDRRSTDRVNTEGFGTYPLELAVLYAPGESSNLGREFPEADFAGTDVSTFLGLTGGNALP